MIGPQSILMMLPELADQLVAGKQVAAAYKAPPRPKPTKGDRLGVVELVGVIDPESSLRFQERIGRLAADDRIGAIALLIDSPGGYASAGFAAADATREAAARKPVHAFVGSVGASAAFMVASQATSITASDWSAVGAIGTYTVLVDSEELFRRLGLRVVVVRAGRFKGITTQGVAITPEDQTEIDRVVHSMNELFLSRVRAGRKLGLRALHELSDGRVWVGADAASRGLVDHVQPFSEWMAAQLAAFPPEQYQNLFGADALKKYSELTASLDYADKQAFRKQHATLTARADQEAERERARREANRQRYLRDGLIV